MRTALLLLLIAVPSLAAKPVTFHGRSIDLEKFLGSFPYDGARWDGSIRNGRLYFLKNEGTKRLIQTIAPLKAGTTFDAAKNATPVDWSKSLTFDWRARDTDGHLFFTADENNDESFNLRHLDPTTGEVTKLSNVAYVAGYGISPDGKRIAYTERMGKEGARFRLHVLDLQTRQDRVIASDTPGQQMTWGYVSWRPDGSGVVVTTLTDGDRNRGNLAYAPVTGTEKDHPRVVTDATVARTFPEAVEDWLDADRVLMRSNEKGAANLYSVHVATGDTKQLTRFGSDVHDAELATPRRLLFTVRNPLRTRLYALDPRDAAAEPKLVLERDADVELLDTHEERALVRVRSATIPTRIELLEGDATRVVLDLSAKQRSDIVRTDVEPVLYETFDDVPMTLGDETHRGKIHAYLYKPRKPLPPGKGIVLVEAFYGGTNSFSLTKQILGALGVHVLSPAPRGVADISEEFEKLNDGDMGGKEVIDVRRGGRWVSEKLGIPAARIGVYGHSHGGYEVMRQLTWRQKPADDFVWGFGVSQSGFSSLALQYETSNIKQWIAKEAGDPAKPGIREQWEDRSPINHVHDLRGKLLLIHGTADQRVPFAISQNFLEKARTLGKGDQVELVPLEGTGHSYGSIPEQARAIRAMLEFLERL